MNRALANCWIKSVYIENWWSVNQFKTKMQFNYIQPREEETGSENFRIEKYEQDTI